MVEKTFTTLECHKIKDKLKEFTVSGLGRKMVDELEPSSNVNIVKRMIGQTTEARAILERSSYVPLQGLHDIMDLLQKLEKGGVLNPGELIMIADFLRGCKKMKKFMKGQEVVAPILSSYRESITEFEDIEKEINNSVEGNRVSSRASNSLAKVRKKIEIVDNKIEQKLQSIISSSRYKDYIQDSFIGKRNDRYVIPIKAAYKHMIDGNIIDKSSTGSTVFIEPTAVANLSNELRLLKIEEENEEYQILVTISGYISLYLREIKINVEAMAEYDFAFAKGKYSNSIRGIEPKINNRDYINILGGRHPLLGEEVVPLDFKIGDSYRTLVITGPNTGGKTISLKTIGLLTIMVQLGLHIPADEGTEMAVFEKIFVDIGDNQSIEQSLSTFSGHMKNIIEIINKTSFSTLVILDELGTGTDPNEGAALAAAILDELYRNGAITVISTHYGELKDYSEQHAGFENGCMEFEPETLKPLYKLTIGKAGKSNGIWICERLGMKRRVLDLAKQYRSGDKGDKMTLKYLKDNKPLIKPKRFRVNESTDVKENIDKKIKEERFEVGDSVLLLDSDKKGIVYNTEDELGNLLVMVRDEYVKVNRKRLRILLKKDQLYPADYDLDTIFVPWKKRKFEKDIKRGAIKNKKEFKKRYEEVIDSEI